MIFNRKDKRSFRKVSILEVNSFGYFDVGLLWLFGEVRVIGGIEFNDSCKAIGEHRQSVGDGGVGMEEMRRKFEDEVLAKDSIGHQGSGRVMNELVDTSVHLGESEGVVMVQEPTDRKESANSFLAIINAIGGMGETSDLTDMGESNTFEVLFTGTEVEGGNWSGISTEL